MVLDLNSSPPPDDEGGWAEPDVEDTTTGQILILPCQNLFVYMVHICLICIQVLTFLIAAEEPDAHWINQARDLQVILAASGTGCFADGDSLRPDGSQESYEDIYRDLLMVGYERDECFRVVCGIDKYRMRSATTLCQLAVFLSKRSDIDLAEAQQRNTTPQVPLAPVGGRRPKRKNRKMLTNKQRWEVYQELLKDSNSGRLKKTSTADVASKLGHSRRQVQSVWKIVKDCIKEGREVDVTHKKSKNCGRKRIVAPLAQVQSIPKRKKADIECTMSCNSYEQDHSV
jgi:hypothetical protein